MTTFFNELPPEIAAEYEELARKQKIQEALMAQNLQPHQNQYGRSGQFQVAVPYSPLEGATKLIQSAMLRKQAQKNEEALAELGKKYEQGFQGEYADVMDTWKGRKEVTDHNYNFNPQFSSAYNMGTGPTVPEVEPDPIGAVTAAMGSADPRMQRVGEGLSGMAPEAADMKDLGVRPKAIGKDGQGNDMWQDYFYVKTTGEDVKPYGKPYSKASTAASTDITFPGADKFADEWAKMQVGSYEENFKAAENAASGKQNMERFISNNEFASAGAAQPLFTSFKNFMSSFGMDSASLTSEVVMDQARAGTLVNYMREMGARGLTDKDMEILNRSLPRLNTSKEARLEVANVMIRNYDKTLNEFSNKHGQLLEKNPEVRRFTVKPLWLIDWENEQASNKEVDEVNKLIESDFGVVPANPMIER